MANINITVLPIFEARDHRELTDRQNSHNVAVACPRGVERAIIMMMKALSTYANGLGNDYLIGQEHWADMARAVRGLLNGDTGRLDCGKVDGWIVALGEEHGINLD